MLIFAILIYSTNANCGPTNNQEICTGQGHCMAIASNSDDETLINNEFSNLNKFFKSIKKENKNIQLLSMGMSKDYKIAIKNGSNMIRLGSMIFS